MPDPVVLYGNDLYTSPYVFSVFVTLEEKGVPYRLELLSLDRREHARPEYASASITGKVPALRHGDFWLAESSAIDEYVDEAFPPPAHPRLYPEDPRQRGRVRMVQAFLRSDLAPLRHDRPTSSFFLAEGVKPLSPEARASAEKLVGFAGAILGSAPRFVAERFSPADADLALMLQRLVANGDPVPGPLADWARTIFARPSIVKWCAKTKFRDHSRSP
jgi:glutathione S-transferase